MKNNANHKVIYQQAAHPGDITVEVVAHKWECGFIAHYVIEEHVFNRHNEYEDAKRNERYMPEANFEHEVQRQAIARFDALVAEYGKVKDGHAELVSTLPTFEEVMAQPIEEEELPFATQQTEEDEFPW